MKSHYRVVVIGGGVVGASVLYHLADPNIAALQAYTIDLLSEIEKESGHSVGMHMTGGLTLAGTPDRWEWLQSAYRTFQSLGIEDVRLVSPESMRCTLETKS